MSNDPNDKRRLPRIVLRGRNAPQSSTPAKAPAEEEGKVRIGGFSVSPWMLTIIGAIISRMTLGGGNNANNTGNRRSRNNGGTVKIGNPFGCGCRTLGCLVILVILGLLIIFRVIPIGLFGR